MAKIVPKTPAQRAHLLRAIARTVTEALPAPMIIETDPTAGLATDPVSGYVSLRFDDDAVAAVDAWAEMLGVEATHDQMPGYGWHWVGTDAEGTVWNGWMLHVWCKVTGDTADQSNSTEETLRPAAGGAR